MVIAFDVDGTLFDEQSKPRNDVIAFLEVLHQAGHSIIVWSGGGQDYAEQRARDAGVREMVHIMAKSDAKRLDREVDVSFDDQEVTLAKTNIKV